MSFWKDFLIPVVAMFAVIAATVLLLVAPVSYAECRAKWRDSGMQVDWGLFSGCRVSDDGETWTPEDSFKSVETR